MVKSPSGRCSLPVKGEWRHGESGRLCVGMAAGGGAERTLGQLGLHPGEVTGGSSDSSPWMCSGPGARDSHSFHTLSKAGAFKNCDGEVIFP